MSYSKRYEKVGNYKKKGRMKERERERKEGRREGGKEGRKEAKEGGEKKTSHNYGPLYSLMACIYILPLEPSSDSQ